MRFNIKYAVTSSIGKVRKKNEDNYWCDGSYLPSLNQGSSGISAGLLEGKRIPAFAVFDGMGGESCGEIAAALAAESFHGYYQGHKKEFPKNPGHFLKELHSTMNHSVCAYAEENGISSMGSTSALVFFWEDWMEAANLGDSRIYLLHGENLEQISEDHVFYGGFYLKPPLSQFLGLPESEALLEPSFYRTELAGGDRILLCTDGVTDMITNKELGQLLQQQKDVEGIVSDILETALQRGGRDNATLILLEALADEKEWRIPGWLRRRSRG